MFGVNLNEIDVEFCVSALLLVLENDGQVGRVLVSFEDDSVIVLTEFHDLAEVSNVQAEGHGFVTSEFFESL